MSAPTTLVPVTGPKAVRRLRRHGFADSNAAELVDGGLAYEFDGEPLIADLARDGLLDTEDIFIAWLAPGLSATEAGIRQLVSSAARRWPTADRVLVRGPANPAWKGIQTATQYIEYLTKQAVQRPPSSRDIRAAQDQDQWDWVHNALADALVNGYRSAGHPIEKKKAREFVRTEYAPEDNPSLHALLLYEANRPVGHSTWITNVEDDLTGDVYDELVDILVDPEFQGGGVTAALLGEVESAAAERGAVLLGNVVADGPAGGWHRVTARLLNAGWERNYTLWVITPR